MSDKKISILIVDTAVAFGGSIVSTANLIRGLDRRKFEPIFVSGTSEDLVRSKLQEASKDTKVVIARQYFNYLRLERLHAVMAHVPLMPVRKALMYLLYVVRLIGNIPYILKIARLVAAHDINLIQLNNAFGNDEVELICLLSGRPSVMFFRGYTYPSRIERSLFLPKIRAYVSVSNFVRDEAIADGVPADRIRVATPPAIAELIDAETLQGVRRRYGVRDGEFVFGIFGRIVEWKGQREFLSAAAPILKSFPNSKAFIVGDIADGSDEYLRNLKDQIAALGLEDRIVFTGYIERIYELYGIMDVVVHSSIEPEPSGRVIFESMSYAIPVIASSLGGPREFIDDGEDGFICDPKDPETVTSRIRFLIENPDRRRTMGHLAEQKISTKYGSRAYAEQIERVYLDCVRAG